METKIINQTNLFKKITLIILKFTDILGHLYNHHVTNHNFPTNIINMRYSNHHNRKRLLNFASILLLILQILYFGSLAPKAILQTAKYLAISENNFIVRVLSNLVELECSAPCDEQKDHLKNSFHNN